MIEDLILLRSIDALRDLPPSVRTVVTSPPYFGLRAYGDDPDELAKDAITAVPLTLDVGDR